MNKKRGFTLIELLVAGTIVGILVLFATIAYRNSVAETRLAAAKGKLELLGGAVQRAQFDYPGLKFYATKMSDAASGATCSMNANATVSASMLIPCGYLENMAWAGTGDWFEFYACPGGNGGACSRSNSGSGDKLACMNGVSAKLPSKYSGSGYSYCMFTESMNEVLN